MLLSENGLSTRTKMLVIVLLSEIVHFIIILQQEISDSEEMLLEIILPDLLILELVSMHFNTTNEVIILLFDLRMIASLFLEVIILFLEIWQRILVERSLMLLRSVQEPK